MLRLYSVLVALISGCCGLLADEFDLGTHGKLRIDVAPNWVAQGDSSGAPGYNITIKPNNEVNAAARITVLYLSGNSSISDTEMQTRFASSLEKLASGSLETRADLKRLKLASGTGFYASFTDASLAGKPSQPGNYKVMTNGMAKLGDDLVLALTLFSDDKTSPEYVAGMKMFESVKLTPP
jgi:hypothetical protein